MPMTPSELAELTPLIAAARKKPINFGLCIGKKPDTTIFFLHRKKSPEILARLAKKSGDTAKVAMGSVSISGKKMMLTITGDAPSGLQKRMKVFLASIKMPFIVTLLDESGNAIGEGEEAQEGRVAEAASPDASAPPEPERREPPAATKEEIAAFKTAYAAAKKRLKAVLRLKVNVSALKTDLAEADKLAKAKKVSEAMAKLTGMDPKFDTAEQEYADRKKKEARDAIDLAKTYLGAALEVAKLEVIFKALETEAAKSPIDSKKISAIVKSITRKEKQLKRAGKKYKKEYDKVSAHIKKYCEDNITIIDKPLVAAEVTQIKKDILLARKKLDEHSAALAQSMSSAINGRIVDAENLIDENTAYLALKSTVETKLVALYADRANGIESDCVRLEAKQAQAQAFEDKRAFYDADLTMKAIDGEIAGLKAVVVNYKVYATSLSKLQAQLVALKNSPQIEFVEPEFKALLAGLKSAMALATNKDLAKATNKTIDLLAEAKALEVKAAKAAPLTDFANGIESGDVDKLRQQAIDILAELKAHPRAKLAPHLLTKVEERVDNLDSIWNKLIESAARGEMKEISALADEARKKLDSADTYYKRATTLGANTTQLGSTHPQAAYIRPFIVKIAAIVKKAKADALASAADIGKALAEGERLLDLAKTTADAEVAYRAHKATAETGVAVITDPAFDFQDKVKVLADIQTQIDAAEAFSKTFKHEDAEKALGKVDTLVITAKIGASAKAGTPPNKAEIQKLLDQPDGEKALDALVSSLPDSTQQDVMKNVLEVRFGMKVNVYDKEEDEDVAGAEKSGRELDVPAPKLLAYYEVLKSVPATHTNLNPSLMRFDSVEEDEGGWYRASEKRVVIELDDTANDPMGSEIGDPDALDSIDPDSVCPAIADEPTQASWTTYHEIGHAVDDRQSFMTSKAKNPDFGGWIEYGSNIAPVAAAAAAEFEYDPSYVERILAGGKPKKPKIPKKLSEKEGRKAGEIWSKRRKNFEAWHKAVSVGSDPWASASTVNTHKIGTVMYQEAYANNWVSYIAAARSKGVTGYQFRAPGEWFAELYAAYHSKKLNSSHPANSWLPGL